ncbi:MAG: hypothetical protein HXY40_08605 [Chloroflexi bacterium]|nr:hypothetical protein [Chloroflexota bacterium]
MSAIETLRNRIDLTSIPFTDRGARILLFRQGHTLALRLAERWEQWQAQVGHYRQRPPLIEDFCLLDSVGAPLELTAETYPHAVHLHSAAGVFDLIFVDDETLALRLPAGHIGLRFGAHLEHGQTDRRGGVLRGVRQVAYTTNARIVRSSIDPAEGRLNIALTLQAEDGDMLLLNITPGRAFKRALPDFADALAQARARWQKWFAAAPPVLQAYRAQYYYAWWVMGINLLAPRDFFTREACAPSKIHYVGVWHWDQFFHALAYRHRDTRLAEDQIRILLDHQRADGLLPDAIHDEGLVLHLSKPVDEDVTKPPLAAWAALKIYEKSQNEDFLQEVYEPLTRWHGWWLNHSRNANGLCEYRHPFSSGLDDSPLWDEGLPVVAPDLNTYLCLQCDSLARIAELIGLAEDAARWQQQADTFADLMLAHLWDEQRGYFAALYQGRAVPVFTPFHLLPLWSGRLPQAHVRRLLAHLTDPAHFWTDYPLATVSRSDPKFDARQMWRGPSWVNINYLFIEALRRIGQPALAQKLRRDTLALLMRHDDIYEYYDPLDGTRPPKAAPIFGWSSAVFIDLAIQESAERLALEPA